LYPIFGVAKLFDSEILKFIYNLKSNDIQAYEIGFANNNFIEQLNNNVLGLSADFNIKLSCHLPFWINLGNKSLNNFDLLKLGLEAAERINSIAVFHLGFYGGSNYNDIKSQIIELLTRVIEKCDVQKGKLGIETTGKQKALGTIDEIIDIINTIDNPIIEPVIDWSHIYARNNGTYPYSFEDFIGILEKFENEIGYRPRHFHGGGIEYKNGNEVKHISSQSYEPPIPNLFQALKKLQYDDFTFIVESPTSIEDIKWLKNVWEKPEKYINMNPKKHRSTSLLSFFKQ